MREFLPSSPALPRAQGALLQTCGLLAVDSQGVPLAQVERDFIATHRPTSLIKRLATVDEVAPSCRVPGFGTGFGNHRRGDARGWRSGALGDLNLPARL